MGRRSLEQIQEDEQLEQLPVSRIKTIMKSSPEVEGIRKEALFLVNKATEFFIQFLASSAYSRAKGTHELDYNYLSEIVQEDKRLTFMADLFPQRITYKEYKALMEQKKKALIARADEYSKTINDGSPKKKLAIENNSQSSPAGNGKGKNRSPIKNKIKGKFDTSENLNFAMDRKYKDLKNDYKERAKIREDLCSKDVDESDSSESDNGDSDVKLNSESMDCENVNEDEGTVVDEQDLSEEMQE